jgi:integrase
MRFATVAQVSALADAVPARYRALVLVAAFGGLRWAELVGLRVRRVDLLHGRVTVAEQVSEVNGRFIPGPPKTEAGRRTLTLPALAAAALDEHLGEFAEAGPDGLVFPAPKGGYLRRSNFNRRVWQPAAHAAGVEGVALSRPSPQRGYPRPGRRGEHPRVDGAHGPHLPAGRAALPTRDGRP